MDADKNQEVSLEEFRDFVLSSRFEEALMKLEIAPQDVLEFFDMLIRTHSEYQQPDSETKLNIEFLVLSCLDLHGPASSMDMRLARYELKMLKLEHRRALSMQRRRADHLRGHVGLKVG